MSTVSDKGLRCANVEHVVLFEMSEMVSEMGFELRGTLEGQKRSLTAVLVRRVYHVAELKHCLETRT